MCDHTHSKTLQLNLHNNISFLVPRNCETHSSREELYEVPCSRSDSVLKVEPLFAEEEEILNIYPSQLLSRIYTTAY